uniref:Armadillo-like helical domain-containing protein n=1 Tax=Anopheles farauti TaxID=69004 RepID=A0A182QTW2_9DIPT
MNKLKEYESIINAQKEHISRYESRLKAERNRIEEVLKHERNQLRQELASKDAVIEEKTKRILILENQSRTDSSVTIAGTSVDQLLNDAKYEDQSLKIRELKKRLDDERNLNEQLELQLGNLKTQFLLNMPDRMGGSKKRADQMNAAATEQPLEAGPNSAVNLKESLQDLQKEMMNLKKQYAIAVADEKQRVRLAEESSKRLREIHEERVANFESRIRELSEMVGKYDRLKEQDKEHILQLKNTIASLQTQRSEQDSSTPCENLDRESIEDGYITRQRPNDHPTGLAPGENDQTKCDLNISADAGTAEADVDTQNELEKYKRRYEQTMSENQRLKKELLLNQECIAQLKQKIDIQKQSTAQLESELQQKLTEQQMALKNETSKHAEVLSAMQASFERQIGHLQDSLQKQRERSLAVMDEKDEEIKTLRTSLEILSLSAASGRQQEPSTEAPNDVQGDGNRWNAHTDTSSMMISSFASMDEEHQHLLHYAQEIAPMASRKRSGSGTKRPKEKVVHIYELLCRGEDPKRQSAQFWEEFFLLQPNMDMLESELLKLSSEQYPAAKRNILELFTECINILSSGNAKRIHNALQTIGVFIHVLFRKQTIGGAAGTGGDFNNGSGQSITSTPASFITVSDIEEDMRELLKQLYDILASNIASDRPKDLCMKILLIIATGIDNVNENRLIEFIIGQNMFEAFKHILSDSTLRNQHGHDVVTLLTLLVNYRKHEGSNPYVVELSLLADEFALNGAHMRHRKLASEKISKPQPLATTLLDLLVEFIVSHLLKKFPIELYLLCIGIIHRIIIYQKRCRVRLAYHWKELWTAMISLLKFLIYQEQNLMKKCNIFELALQVINIFNLFITYGDTFLATTNSYDELYYELNREEKVFCELHAMVLRYASMQDCEYKEDAIRLLNALSNILAIIKHFQMKIKEWLASQSLSTPTEQQILEQIQKNYDLTLKLQDSLDQYERYSERPKHVQFFANLVKQVMIDTRKTVYYLLKESNKSAVIECMTGTGVAERPSPSDATEIAIIHTTS